MSETPEGEYDGQWKLLGWVFFGSFLTGVAALCGLAVANIWAAEYWARVAGSVAAVCGILMGASFIYGLMLDASEKGKRHPMKAQRDK